MVNLSCCLLLPILLLVRIPGDCRETSEEESPKTECCPGQESHAVYDSETGMARCLGTGLPPSPSDCEGRSDFSQLRSSRSNRKLDSDHDPIPLFNSNCRYYFKVKFGENSTIVKAFVSCPNQTVHQKYTSINLVPKCCPWGKSYDLVQDKCRAKPSPSPPKGTRDEYTIIIDDLTSNNCSKIYLTPERNPQEYFEFTETGHLHVPAKNATYSNGEFCLDHEQITDGSWIQLARICNPEDRKVKQECEEKGCVRKCCNATDLLNVSQGRSVCMSVGLDDRAFLIPPLIPPFPPSNGTYNGSNVITIHPTCNGNDMTRIMLQPVSAEETKARFYLTQSWGLQSKETRYCIDETGNSSSTMESELLVCMKETLDIHAFWDESGATFIVHSVLLVVLATFLLLTFFLYLVLPEIKGNSETYLPSYVGCLAVACVALLVSQFGARHGIPDKLCFATAVIISYSCLAAFSWLNVMCFDLWWNVTNPFSSLGDPMMPSEMKRRQTKKWIRYALYAFGVPSAIVTIACVVEFTRGILPDVIQMGMARYRQCWLHGHEGTIWFYYGPIALLLVANIIFFALTSRCLFLHAKDTAHLTRKPEPESHSRNREQFWLYVKLFVMMGLSWVTEVISFFVKEPNELFLFTDAINSLQGLFIFLIVICKRKNQQVLKKRIVLSFTRRRSSAPSEAEGSCRRSSAPSEAEVSCRSGIGRLGMDEVRPARAERGAGGIASSQSTTSEGSRNGTSSSSL
ncbi:unnamed protein product [Darwinula stevensoni]|uniref:G-protein coupled receptors family 2 profile 2 domain-containing protein n=1 Tax=Darwinula stevensoni TaxID=69355 RepID=A0A7R9AEN6_9CRUS|nr:unnamed protein product [Darwinula stevensoni]CAG0902171.1 unnamed protein product [Darwinula stevensoni]